MVNTYQIYLISDSTGETLERIFLALKAQFKNIEYKIHSYSFTRTENQILKILEDAQTNNNSIILYTIVDNNLAKYLANTSGDKKNSLFWCFGKSYFKFFKNSKPKSFT
jgi:regulator of PEP synthase PpsR (kinase-PPPase family)